MTSMRGVRLVSHRAMSSCPSAAIGYSTSLADTMSGCPSTAIVKSTSPAVTMSGCPFAAIVKATAPAVAPKVREIVDDFYPRMFSNSPEAKAFFNPANQFKEPPLQRMALANAVVAYATSIDDLSKLTGALEIIAHKHCGLGVKPRHYSIVHQNLMESIGHVMGDAVTPEVGEGWSEAVLALAKNLCELEAKLYAESAGRRGGWKGVKDFRVAGTRRVATDCVELTFKPVDGAGPIDFTPGQFLTLHLHKQGSTPRHYTVTNAPGKDYLQCCPKLVEGGFVSSALHGMKEGDVVGVSAPFGTFKLSGRPAVLCSAGVGATPMKCFLDSAPEQVKFVLHIDRDEAAHPFRKEMEASSAGTHFHYTDAGGRPEAAALVEGALKPYLAECDFFLCGPPPFLADMSAALKAAGARSIHLDVFGPALAQPN